MIEQRICGFFRKGTHMALQKVEQQNISEIVFRQLEQSILSGDWKPGEKIPSENVLSTQLGVSRVTVRNAIQRLSGIGLVEARQGGGTYVKISSDEEALQLLKPILTQMKPDVRYFLEYRLAMEPEMAAMAAQRATQTQMTQMQEYVGLYEAAVRENREEEILPYDSKLHYAIAEASANPLIIKTYELLKEIYSRNLSQIVQDLGPVAGIRYHKKIVGSICSHDAEAARDYMRRHIQETIDLYQSANP